jgi:hypothetical protein
MRHILIDEARSRESAKRGGRAAHVTLADAGGPSAERPADLVALDEALTRLEADYPRRSRVVELR